jgi:hypothetical protein
MITSKYVLLEDFCRYHAVEVQFIEELGQHRLIQIREDKSRAYLFMEELPRIEKIIRLRDDLELNLPGIEVTLNLLAEIDRHKARILELENRLRRFNE